ncbi:MAG: hypothetical protein AAGE43_05445 [Pseudomonadota bacterium]
MSDTDKDKDDSASGTGAGALEARLAESLKTERDNLAPDVRERLGAMRREAVKLAEEAAEANAPASILRRWFGALPLAATATAGLTAALALGVWLASAPGAGPAPLPAISEAEAAVMQDLELLEELEFLAWLEEESAGAG